MRFLICTDVAARGIDVKGLPFVINMTLPDSPENYIHRAGRVGRADCVGLALSIVSPVKKRVWFHRCSNRGKGCTARGLLEEGGCTTWYDEPSLFSAVEKRLRQNVALMSAAYELPEGLGFHSAKVYGELSATASAGSAGGVCPSNAELHRKRLQRLQPTVQALAEMEYNTQNNFLTMQTLFH